MVDSGYQSHYGSLLPLELKEIGTVTDLATTEELDEIEVISLIEEQLPKYQLRADSLATFSGYDKEDWYIAPPQVDAYSDPGLTLEQVEETLKYFILCGYRVSQMTKTYNDIEAVTRLLEEKERDLELAARIGQSLLARNKVLEGRNATLEADIAAREDSITQLRHDLSLKSDLLELYANDGDTESETGTPTKTRSLSVDLLQKRVKTLEDENSFLKSESSSLLEETQDFEERERSLIHDVVKQLSDVNQQYQDLSREHTKKVDDFFRQQEEITTLLAQVCDLQAEKKRLMVENEEIRASLQSARETQLELTSELADLKLKYAEILELYQDTQEEMKRQDRRRSMVGCRRNMLDLSVQYGQYNSQYLRPDSLASELQRTSLPPEESLEFVSSPLKQSNYHNVFMTKRLTSSKSSNRSSAVASPVPPHVSSDITTTTLTSSFGSSSIYDTSGLTFSSRLHSSTGYTSSGIGESLNNSGALSLESAGHSDSDYSLLTDSEEQTNMKPQLSTDLGYNTNDLTAALKTLNPTEVYERRRRMEHSITNNIPSSGHPCHSPDSIMSTGISRSGPGWKLPEKLKIVKPMEGSLTLNHWARLATPHMAAIFEERPGVQSKGQKSLFEVEDVFSASDVEEDVEFECPGKAFVNTGSVYTYTNSTVMHPEDPMKLTSSLQGASVSAFPYPPTSGGGSDINRNSRASTSTFSTTKCLSRLLNERSATGTAVGTPANENYLSLATTPMNSPSGSPPDSSGFGLSSLLNVGKTMSRGADLLRRALTGISPSTERRAHSRTWKSDPPLNLVERLHRMGLEEAMSSPCLIAPLSMSGMGHARMNPSPMKQLTSLKSLSSGPVDDPKRSLGVPGKPGSHKTQSRLSGIARALARRPDLGTVGFKRPPADVSDPGDDIGTLLTINCGRKGGLL